MTAAIVAISLVLAPAPITETTQGEVPWPTPARHADTPATTLPTIDEQMARWLWDAPTTTPASSVTAPSTTTPSSPPPTNTSAAPVSPKSDRQLVDEILGWPFPAIITCESNWNRWAVGAAGERGLTQIHPVHKGLVARMGYTWAQMHEVEPNLRVAAEIRRTQGLRAWTCWRG